ncbi:MAG TPA: hypothetical protein PK643_14980, partial [Saprospiraceae bacterium]|nr:hypothetical protein [Saprospiraceae bacterium]
KMDPNLQSISIARLPKFEVDSTRLDSMTVAMIRFSRKPNTTKLNEIKSFLAGWTRTTDLKLIVN